MSHRNKALKIFLISWLIFSLSQKDIFAISGDQIVANARNYKGIMYGTTVYVCSNAIVLDCSGLVSVAAGYDTHYYTTSNLWSTHSSKISWAQLSMGDILLSDDNSGDGERHVMIFISWESGNGGSPDPANDRANVIYAPGKDRVVCEKTISRKWFESKKDYTQPGKPDKDVYFPRHLTVTNDVTLPTVSNIDIILNPTKTNLTITATARDTQSRIIKAEFFVDIDLGICKGTKMFAKDGAFDELTEEIGATIDISGLSDGRHSAYVRVKDACNNWSPTVRVFFTIDTTPPKVISIHLIRPGESLSLPIGIPISIPVENVKEFTQLSVSFSEPMDKPSVEKPYAVCLTGDISLVNPSWSYNTVTFNLSKKLDWGKMYCVKVSTGVKDLAGNSLPSPVYRSFMTKEEKQPEVEEELGGIDFRSADLVYISGDPLTQNGIQFVIKAEEALPGEPTVNLAEERKRLLDVFLAALAIPNDKQWVSLPARWDGTKWVGDVEIDSVLAKTELGRIMLDADVKMKFSDLVVMRNMYKEFYDQWTSLVRSSPYYEQIHRYGFNEYPYWAFRTWICPDEVTANAEEGKIFISTARVKVKTELMMCELNLSPYRFPSYIVNDLNNRLKTWESIFINKLRTVREPTITESLNNDPEYKDMREAYAAVAIAQWYKRQDRSKLFYRDLIDSKNITGLEIPFDRDYWANQALQYIDAFTFTNFFGQQERLELWGGCELIDASVDVAPGISS